MQDVPPQIRGPFFLRILAEQLETDEDVLIGHPHGDFEGLAFALKQSQLIGERAMFWVKPIFSLTVCPASCWINGQMANEINTHAALQASVGAERSSYTIERGDHCVA